MTEHFPLLTIGMPVKNEAWCIRETLKAIVKIIFVDDYSTDGTFEILKEWKARKGDLYHGIMLVQKRTNIPQARNVCIENMEGDFILFWDSDVKPPRDLLKEMISIMRKDPTVGIIGADYVYETSSVTHRPIVSKETHATYMGFSLIRREVLDAVGGFDENLSVGEDTEFCIRVMEKTRYKIIWSPRPVLHLKKQEDVIGTFVWLKYNFNVRAEEYYRSFKNLPRLLKARILYYIGLPWIMIISLVSFLIDMPILASILLMYPVPSVWLVVKRKGLKDGITTWLKFNVPTGLALSYGVLRVAIKKLARAGALGRYRV